MDKEKKVYNIIIFGPQGSGKGSQAEVMVKKLKLYHVETGNIFRKMAKQKTAVGKKLNEMINQKGKLVPTDFVIKILKLELKKIKKTTGLIFDGYPRNLKQARALDKIMKSLGRELTHVIYMPISRKTTIKRLSKRRTCSKCNRIFIQGKTLAAGKKYCPTCGGLIFQREDDKPAAINRRLQQYNKQTKPLIDFYKKRGILIHVDGEPTVPVVAKEILKILK